MGQAALITTVMLVLYIPLTEDECASYNTDHVGILGVSLCGSECITIPKVRRKIQISRYHLKELGDIDVSEFS